MSVQEMPGAVISRRMLAERTARDNGLGEHPPDDPMGADLPPSDRPDDFTALMSRPAGVLVTLADVVAERVEWLWPGRLPVGKLVTLDGDPALGKSTLAITLAAHLSTGRTWPDGTACPLGSVVILSAEDGMADTIRPRLDAAGGDATRVHCLTAVNTVTEDGEITTRPPTLADVTQIREVIQRVKARLLVVDVLMAYLPSKTDSHRDQDVRAVLHRVAEVADATGCTVLLLRHLNKSGAGSPMYRGGGSIGIVGAARAGYVVAPDPDDDTGATRVLACVKSNLAVQPDSLTYRLESASGSHVARVVWGEASQHSAADLLRTGDAQEDHSERDAAKEWLTGYLTDQGGSAPAADVKKACRAAGFSERTVERARARQGSGVTTGRTGFGKGAVYVWRIAESTCSPHVRHARQLSEPGKHGAHGGEHGDPVGVPTGKRAEGDRSWSSTSTAAGATPSPDTDPPAERATDDASPTTVSESHASTASASPGHLSSSSATSGAELDGSDIPPELRAVMGILSRDLNATPVNTDSWQHLASGYDT